MHYRLSLRYHMHGFKGVDTMCQRTSQIRSRNACHGPRGVKVQQIQYEVFPPLPCKTALAKAVAPENPWGARQLLPQSMRFVHFPLWLMVEVAQHYKLFRNIPVYHDLYDRADAFGIVFNYLNYRSLNGQRS